MKISPQKPELPNLGNVNEGTSNIIPLYSDDFQAINQWFQASHAPYNSQDIFIFNTLYRRAYPLLSQEEKRRTEEIVDAIIKGVEDRDLIPRIFGVV